MFLSDKLIWSAALRCLAVIVPVALALADETPVTDCDGLAAHPADPHRVSNGVVFDQVDAQTAIRKCQQAVEQFPGSPRLIFQLGRAHNANKEIAQAVKLYRRAAEEGYAAAQNNLGLMYWNGDGVEQDAVNAAMWYRRAAEQGHPEAQINLGWMYWNGEGVDQDRAEALKLYRRAAEQGHPEAQYELGSAYFNGYGVEQDAVNAVMWLRRAAEQGYAAAQYSLGTLYQNDQNGEYIEFDLGEAEQWYRRAAEQGHAKAQYRLATLIFDPMMIFDPKGDYDFPKMLKYLHLASDQRNSEAHYMLGTAYYYGMGLDKNNIKAHMWFSISNLLGHTISKVMLDSVELEMSPEEVEESKRLAHEWLEQN